MTPILRGQSDVSSQVPMPTQDFDALTTTAVSAETLTWSYLNSTVWASATGQAAGTIVVGKLAYTNVLNSIHSAVGSFNDTSVTAGAATRISTLVGIPEDVFSKAAFLAPAAQVALITPFLTARGDYAIDHRRGMIWANSKAVVANDSISYYVMLPAASSTVPAASVTLAPTASGTGAISVDVSAALEASTVTKASAGRIYGLYGRIDKTAASGDYWIQVLNASSLPADGAVTILTVIKKVHVNGVDSFFDLDLTKYGIYAATGIVVCLSTTEFTKTIAGAYLSSTILYS